MTKLPKLTEAEVSQYIRTLEDAATILNRLWAMAVEYEKVDFNYNKELLEQVQQSDFFVGGFESPQLQMTEKNVEEAQGQLERIYDKMIGTWTSKGD